VQTPKLSNRLCKPNKAVQTNPKTQKKEHSAIKSNRAPAHRKATNQQCKPLPNKKRSTPLSKALRLLHTGEENTKKSFNQIDTCWDTPLYLQHLTPQHQVWNAHQYLKAAATDNHTVTASHNHTITATHNHTNTQLLLLITTLLLLLINTQLLLLITTLTHCYCYS